MRKLLNYFTKLFTHNFCDTCGLTKDTVYVTALYTEAGLIECEKCFNKTYK